MRTIVMKTSIGYRDQLDRARRFLSRMQSTEPRRDVDYQDDVWAFFQNCWHIKDWIANDPIIQNEVKNRLEKTIKASSTLKVCYDLATGTKHRDVRKPQAFAQHAHTNTTITPGVETKLDCIFEFEGGKTQSAREVAEECMNEWYSILEAENFATGQRS